MIEKTIKLDINGKIYSVTIDEFSAHEALVKVNGKKYKVGLADLGLEKVADIKPIPAEKYEATKVPAAPASAERKPAEPLLFRPKSLGDTNSIPSPLPGQIQKIYIREGDVIQAGQRIMMIEAMKMENQVHATASGVVAEIRFKEGDSVNQGDVLVLLKPSEK